MCGGFHGLKFVSAERITNAVVVTTDLLFAIFHTRREKKK